MEEGSEQPFKSLAREFKVVSKPLYDPITGKHSSV